MLKSIRYLPIAVSFVTMLLIMPRISQAGGLYLNEFGTPSTGVAVLEPMSLRAMHLHHFTMLPG